VVAEGGGAAVVLEAVPVQLVLLFPELRACAGGIRIAPKGISSLMCGCPGPLEWVEAGLCTQAVNGGSALQR